jgi:hypothetical protein
MAVINTDGNLKIWDIGEPFSGIKRLALTANEVKYWVDGRPWSDFVPGVNAQAKFFMVIH